MIMEVVDGDRSDDHRSDVARCLNWIAMVDGKYGTNDVRRRNGRREGRSTDVAEPEGVLVALFEELLQVLMVRGAELGIVLDQ